ncbi:MAG TPA: hypothetical protein VIL85_25965 [Thermomicrobiales bacterium]
MSTTVDASAKGQGAGGTIVPLDSSTRIIGPMVSYRIGVARLPQKSVRGIVAHRPPSGRLVNARVTGDAAIP